MNQPIRLSHRTIISVTGEDAETFLNGIVTASTLKLETDAYRYGALLTPQGKVIGDMLIAHRDGEILLDCASVAAPALIKRLTLMKLRAAVTITERADLAAFAFTGAPDPRDQRAPHRAIAARTDATSDDAGAYHAARIAAGLAEQGVDFGVEEVFPADINMDLMGGVDFRKGCFVGQEVASRMKRRGTARRRTLKVRLAAEIALPAPILADGFEIGLLTSFSGGEGLARVRIDRMAEAEAAGQAFTANGVALVFDQPDWLAGELAALNEAREAKA
jgi:folate-binding protein YgfZ